MEPITLAEAKANKVREIRGIAENEYWSKFPSSAVDTAGAAKDYMLIKGILGGAGTLTQGNRDTLNAAAAVVEKARAKEITINSRTTIAEVNAITWTSTP